MCWWIQISVTRLFVKFLAIYNNENLPSRITKIAKHLFMGAAIAHWVHLPLPSCSPGFESQAQQQRFVSICIEILSNAAVTLDPISILCVVAIDCKNTFIGMLSLHRRHLFKTSLDWLPLPLFCLNYVCMRPLFYASIFRCIPGLFMLNFVIFKQFTEKPVDFAGFELGLSE